MGAPRGFCCALLLVTTSRRYIILSLALLSYSIPHAIERIVPMVDSLPGDIAIYHTGLSMLPNIPSGSLLHLRPLPHWQEFFVVQSPTHLPEAQHSTP